MVIVIYWMCRDWVRPTTWMERARPVCQFKPVAAQVMMGKQTIRPMSKAGLPRMMTKGKGDDQGTGAARSVCTCTVVGWRAESGEGRAHCSTEYGVGLRILRGVHVHVHWSIGVSTNNTVRAQSTTYSVAALESTDFKRVNSASLLRVMQVAQTAQPLSGPCPPSPARISH